MALLGGPATPIGRFYQVSIHAQTFVVAGGQIILGVGIS